MVSRARFAYRAQLYVDSAAVHAHPVQSRAPERSAFVVVDELLAVAGDDAVEVLLCEAC
ncbi:hypothetical protein SAMN06295924_101483 [Rathayibacter rathayi NCPPB 2980 = VKM Ac-1601]|nr:hypothetical protein FB469_1366 [Rathayibacter rathayi]SOE02642.1 hypothetical protein SAMN06295924_101483 [Rathayibacter rathayi NCPPB 2980 = VKM Ac-1601]